MDKLIDKNLISLKCMIFFFLGGVGCLFPFLPLHIRAVGLSLKETCIISIVAPCVSILGPLIAGPLADKLSVGRGCDVDSSSGKDVNTSGNKVLRIMLTVCFIFAALFYGLLLAVPSVKKLEPRRPSVSFMCGADGATIYQEMCTEEKNCNHWSGEKVGLLHLSDCKYACEKPPVVYPLYIDLSSTTEFPRNVNEEDNTESDTVEPEINPDAEPEYIDTVPEGASRTKREVSLEKVDNTLPHLCYSRGSDESSVCYVYTQNSQLAIKANLLSATEKEYEDTNDTLWCQYPLGGKFQCIVPPVYVEKLIMMEEENFTCNPIIECKIDDPYNATSVLAESQCKLYVGDPDLSFWLYLVFRSFGDAFSLAALCLICTACVIATRETSLRRGDVGRQLAFGIIAMAIIPPLIGIRNEDMPIDSPPYLIPFIVAVVLFVLAALTALIDKAIPLSPPEWWWHTKTGMLALPMNTVRRYGWEIVGVVVVLVLLGIFWSALDTYLPLAIRELKGNHLLLSLTMTVGAIPAIPILWNAERVIDYCGHSNIFIGAFAFYIIRYTGMALLDDPWWVLLCEVFEVFTLSLMWVTAVLYFRHLMPRKFTATGQALAVLAHFCVGRFFGALISSAMAISRDSPLTILQITYKGMAIAACVLGVVYLAVYHLILAPLCRAESTGPPNAIVMQELNCNGTSNGSYTPLRVYHNERGKKGQFRY